MNKETLEEAAEWLNKKFNGKGVEVKIIDWGKNERYNYTPIKLLEEYSKWQQDRMYSEERVEKQKLEFAIEQLNEIKSKMSFFEISNMENTLDNLHYKIQELEQKLSEL